MVTVYAPSVEPSFDFTVKINTVFALSEISKGSVYKYGIVLTI